MTNALGDSIENLDYKDSQYNYFTSPKHPTHPTGLSINDPSDAALSALHALPLLLPLLEAHDGFLIACYSPHPLVQELKSRTRKPVIVIIEASIAVAVQMLRVRLVQTNRHHLMERERSGNYEYDEADAIYGQVPERMSIITTTSARVPVFCKALSSSQPEMLGPEQLFSALESIGMDAALSAILALMFLDLADFPIISQPPPSTSSSSTATTVGVELYDDPVDELILSIEVGGAAILLKPWMKRR